MNWRGVNGKAGYMAFLAVLCAACYRHPLTGDFDRYAYEALVRGENQSSEQIYESIKHASVRTEASSILDSPAHLASLEPLYAIRPLYLRAIEASAFLGLPIQSRINLISALSLLGIGIVVLGWTGKPFYSALLLATPAISILGRMGTPDALSALVVLSALWAVARDRLLPGLVLLLLSLWIRTDNILLALPVIGFLALQKKLNLLDAGVLMAFCAATVAFIDHFSGNYGWQVLFQFSFLRGRSPAEVSPHVSLAEYLGVLSASTPAIAAQTAIWVLLGGVAWKLRAPRREYLAVVWMAVSAHFALFPSPEARYLVWAFLATGMIFVSAAPSPGGIGHRRHVPAFARVFP